MESYLEQKKASISNCEDPINELLLQYEFAQLLFSVEKYKEAVTYCNSAYNSVKKLRDENSFLLERYCPNIGMMYANIFDNLGEYDKSDSVYQELNELYPNGFHLGDYAVFLHRRKKEFEMADRYYKMSLELYPDQSSIHLKYAGFLRHVKRDVGRAEEHYQKAITSNSNNADALGSYASFLHGVHNNKEAAEKYYRKAYELDDTHTNNLCNYGLFLSEERHSYEEAEVLYKRALQVNPRHANTLYNYAVMLDTHLKRKKEAEELYRNALELEPRHAYALYNLAVLLEEQTYQTRTNFILNSLEINGNEEKKENHNGSDEISSKKLEEICMFYRRAVEADPKDSTTMADYGRFLLNRMDDPNKAEPILTAALKLDAGCEIAIYNLALLLHKHKKEYEKTLSLLRLLLEKNKKHNAGQLQLGRVLFDIFRHRVLTNANQDKVSKGVDVKKEIYSWDSLPRDIQNLLDESLHCYENCIKLITEPAVIIAEYLKIVSKYGNNKHKLHAISTMAPKPSDQNVANGVDANQMVVQLIERLNVSLTSNGDK